MPDLADIATVIRTDPEYVWFAEDPGRAYRRDGAFEDVARNFEATQPGSLESFQRLIAEENIARELGVTPEGEPAEFPPTALPIDIEDVTGQLAPTAPQVVPTEMPPEALLAPGEFPAVEAPIESELPPVGPMMPELSGGIPETAAAYQAEAEREALGVEREFAARGEAERVVGDLYARQVAEDAEVERVQAEALEVDRAAVRRSIENYDTAMQRYDDIQIDPRRWWSTAGNGGTVAALLGVALGGFGNALLGRPNDALAIIENAIDRDIQGQMADLSRARYSVEAARSMVGVARDVMQDDQQAVLAARAAAWTRVGRQADALRAQARPAIAAGESERLVGAIGQRTAEHMEAYRQRARVEMREDELERRRRAFRRVRTPAPSFIPQDLYDQLTPAQQVAQWAKQAEHERKRDETPGVDPGRIERAAVRTAEFAAAQDAIRSIEELSDDQIMAGRGRFGGGLVPGATISDISRVNRDRFRAMATIVLRAKSGATATEEEFDRLVDSYGLSDTASLDQTRQGLARLKRELDTQGERTLQGLSAAERLELGRRSGEVRPSTFEAQ